MQPRFAWLYGPPRKPPIRAVLVPLHEAELVGFSTSEKFSDDADGAARLADELKQLVLEESRALVLPARLSSPTAWLARIGRTASASKALRCTALRLAGYDIVQVVDESGYDAVVARKI